MNDVVILVPYFGTHWPSWMNFFVESCKYNEWINWVIFTDIEPPENICDSITYISSSVDAIKERIKKKLEITPTFNLPYKLCDFKITYGILFDEYIKGYKYWGCGDLDVIYGNIGKFLLPFLPYNFNLISMAFDRFSAHFGLLRNDVSINNKFKQIKEWKKFLSFPDYKGIDERPFAKLFDRRECFFLDIDPLDRFYYRRGEKSILPSDYYWEEGDLYTFVENNKIDIPLIHFYVYKRYNMGGKPTYDAFKNLIRTGYRKKKWRINAFGFLPYEGDEK